MKKRQNMFIGSKTSGIRTQGGASLILNKISLPVKNKYQKISSKIRKEAPPCVRMGGSYMVELAVLLPFFTGLMVVLLFYFQILMVHQEVGNALLASGRELSVLAAAEKEEDSVLSAVAAKALLLKNLKTDSSTEAFVKGGRMGISLNKSDFSGEYIDLQANYKLQLPIGLFGKQSIAVSQRLKCRKWIGSCGNSSDSEEEIVYITPNGTVYHRNRDCKFISLSISCIAGNSIEGLRNADGGKYYACSKCMKDKNQSNMMVYITKYGNRFHSSRTCSRIKRTVLAVRISEVGKRSACSKCGRE